MCDTLGRLGAGSAIFAKNSDRSPNEVQLLEYYPGGHSPAGQVQCTYISATRTAPSYGVLLSRPAWMWGAEMGVNDSGVCIGNEAVFTKGAYGKTGLTGMDMVRLALERSATAGEALKNLIALLEEYGQGGNCGYDHGFYYDNAFLVMDRENLFVLETAGRSWVSKRYAQASISNGLTIGTEGDAYSGGVPVDFRKNHREPVYTTFSRSDKRRRQTQSALPGITGVGDAMDALRGHDPKVKNPFAAGSVGSVCMHYGGLVGDHTTASMVVSLEKERTLVWATGTSLPCVSLFKPWLMGTEPVLPVTAPGDGAGKDYWLAGERFRRSLLGRKLPEAFFAGREDLQGKWVRESGAVSREDFPEFARKCLAEEKEFYALWDPEKWEKCPCAPGFLGRWRKKTAILRQEHPDF